MSRLDDRKTEGIVFNIQKYSVHDGPGIRTIAFLKGCHLHCRWCCNPESQLHEPQLAFNKKRCIGLDKCQHCLEVCTRGALVREEDDSLRIDRSLCKGCSMPCAEACVADALNIYGEKKTVDEVLKVIEEDAPFYARSGGGMTLSGGEPFLQADFALALLREARARYIRTCVETCGLADQNVMLEGAKFLNFILFDIKNMDPEKHREWTGHTNEKILENFRAVCEEVPDKTVRARTPIIPGFNDNARAVEAIAEFLEPFGSHVQYEMLPYHKFVREKYFYLGRDYAMGDAELNKKKFAALQGVARKILGDRFIS